MTHCNFTNFRCAKILVASDHSGILFSLNFGVREYCGDHSTDSSHLGVFLISVKPLSTKNTENKTSPKICKITVLLLVKLEARRSSQSQSKKGTELSVLRKKVTL